MKHFYSTLPGNIIGCFRGRMLLWHLLAIVLTLILVESGLDWRYFLATRSPGLRVLAFPAAVIGFFVPFTLPVLLIAVGGLADSQRIRLAGWAIGQAEIIGALLAVVCKAFTGRAHPMLRDVGDDLSHLFRFGFLRGGVFWGWPSSHTIIAFAMAATVFTLFPKQRWLGWMVVAYALYIGLGVSMTIHWLSDFVAGAIVGCVVGVVVGRRFRSVAPTTE